MEWVGRWVDMKRRELASHFILWVGGTEGRQGWRTGRAVGRAMWLRRCLHGSGWVWGCLLMSA